MVACKTSSQNSIQSPFGMVMPGRNWTAGTSNGYGFGFNGKLKDDEIMGNSNSYDFGARFYDCRIGKFLAIDPSFKQFPSNSPYLFADNRPVDGYDEEGKGFEQYFNGMTTMNISLSYQWHKGFGVSFGLGVLSGTGEDVSSRLATGLTLGINTEDKMYATMGFGLIANLDKNNIGFPIVQNFYPSLNSIVNDFSTSVSGSVGVTASENYGLTTGGQLSFNFNAAEMGAFSLSGNLQSKFSDLQDLNLDIQKGGAQFSYTVPSQIASPVFANPNATIPEPIGDRSVSLDYYYNSNLQKGFENNFSLSVNVGAFQGLGLLSNSTTQFGGFNNISTTSPNYLQDFNFSHSFNYTFSIGYSYGNTETYNDSNITPKGGLNVGGTISSTSYSEGN